MAVNRDKILRGAEKLVQKGKIEQAIKEYEKLLKANPNEANTINRMGDLYGRIGKVDRAIELYERIADHFTEDGFTTKAIAILKKINRLAPQRLDIFDRLAELYVQQGLVVEAKNQYQMLADWYSRNEDFEKAIETHKKLISLDSSNHMAHLRLADLLMQSGQTDEAVEAYDRLGQILLKRDKLDEAERLYRHALDQNPPSGEFLLPLCSALLEADRTTVAREMLGEALERSPDSHDLRVMQVRTLLALGEASKAQAKGQAILEKDPDNEEMRLLVGRALLASGEAAQARDILLPAAEAQLTHGNFVGAQELLQDLIKATPQDVKVLTLALRAFESSGEEEMLFTLRAALAESHFRSGEEQAARRVYLELLKAKPDNKLFRERLAKLDGQDVSAVSEPAPEPESAAPDVGDAVEPVEPVAVGETKASDPKERLAEANVFAKYGLMDKAIHHLHAIVKTNPEFVEAREKLVLLLAEQNPQGALTIAEPLVRHYRENNNEKALASLYKALPGLERELAAPEPAAAPPAAVEPAAEPELDSISSVAGDEVLLDFDDGELAEELAEKESLPTFDVKDAVELEPVAETAVEEVELEFEAIAAVEEGLEPIEFEIAGAEEEAGEPAGAAVGEIEDVSEADAEDVSEMFTLLDESIPAEIDLFEQEVRQEEQEPQQEQEQYEVEFDAEPAAQVEFAAVEPQPEAPEAFAPAVSEVSEPEPLAVEPQPDAPEAFAPVVSEISEPEPLAVEPEPRGSSAAPPPEAPEAFAPVVSEVSEPEPLAVQEQAKDEVKLGLGAVLDAELEGVVEAGQVAAQEVAPIPAVEFPAPAAVTPQPPLPGMPMPGQDQLEEALVEITGSVSGPSLSDIGQIDFFIDQELFEDAAHLIDKLEVDFPGEADLVERRAILKTKGYLAEELPTATEAPEELFADEDEFIDLAGEIEEEFAEEDAMVEEATGSGHDEAELEEVFREFQKGVSQQLSEEDSDTHFNLGIAYKEMGLVSEAIREFQIASRDSGYFIECCSMIGVCFVEQGMFENAAEWYRRALVVPDLSPDSRLALSYDLASALEMSGDKVQAARLFEEIVVENPTFRDASRRLINIA